MMFLDKKLKEEDSVRKEHCAEALDILEKSGLKDWGGFEESQPKAILIRGGSGQVHVGDVFRGVFPTLEYFRQTGTKLVLASSPGLQKIFASWSDTLRILDASKASEYLVERFIEEGCTEVTKWGRLHREWRKLKGNIDSGVVPLTPFVQPPRQKIIDLRRSYAGNSDKRVLGIIWRTSMIGRKGGRDSSLEDFIPLIELGREGWNIISLQYGDMDRTEKEIRKFSKHTGLKVIFDESVDPMKDYVAASAQMAACDHIVSIDCSQIFQAGAGAVPVSVLLPHETAKQWEEFADKKHPNRCPFFPETARLFRQKNENDWGSPIEKAKQKLLENSEEAPVWSHQSALWARREDESRKNCINFS